MVLFLYTKEISPVIGEKQNVIDLKTHSKQCNAVTIFRVLFFFHSEGDFCL